MKGTILKSYDPFFNLALEDFLLHTGNDEYFLLSVNSPSVITGRHQVIYMEADIFAARELNMPVIRRISGGGTVFHDEGNINFTLIRNSSQGKQIDFELHTRPVIEFLRYMGINAMLTGKSNITVDGLKVSGNAEHVFRERVLHHGTLLFNSSLDKMKRVIRGKTEHYSTKAIESNRAQVINLRELLPDIANIDDLASMMFDYIKKNFFPGMEVLTVAGQEVAGTESLAESKYRTWGWNYGFSPPYSFSGSFEAYGSPHRVTMYVKDGIIWKCDITGSDLMAVKAKQLIGCRHMPEDIMNIFRSENIEISDTEIERFF